MADDQKTSRWHPSVVAALIGAVATILGTAIAAIIASRDDAPPAVATPARSSNTTERPLPLDRPEPVVPSARETTSGSLRGYYSASSAMGTHHLKINNNGSFQLSPPGGARAVGGNVSANGNDVALHLTDGTTYRYVRATDGSLTGASGVGEPLVFVKGS